MQPFLIIYSNFPHCKEWQDDSFLGILDDHGVISYEKYWQLELAILQVTPMDKSGDAQHLLWPIFRIFSHAMLLFLSHHSEADGFSIKDMNNHAMRDFIERFQMIFEGFFRGELPSSAAILSYEKRNPLLELD
ncbi:Imm41 family immunity protein [Corticibacter populi]|nr:Imm41 family immunity protein [Corticibacter populi]RZS35070.1 immunity protein 41 of polymorphic toxin system [Corticibacter populi]